MRTACDAPPRRPGMMGRGASGAHTSLHLNWGRGASRPRLFAVRSVGAIHDDRRHRHAVRAITAGCFDVGGVAGHLLEPLDLG